MLNMIEFAASQTPTTASAALDFGVILVALGFAEQPAVEQPAVEQPAVEQPAVDNIEHWFSIGCRCEWCDAIRVALENYVHEQPWSCPRCESINSSSPVCEACDTDIRVAHRVN